jgi:hypothetical protein
VTENDRVEKYDYERVPNNMNNKSNLILLSRKSCSHDVFFTIIMFSASAPFVNNILEYLLFFCRLDTLRLAIEKATRVPQGSQILMTSDGLQLKSDMIFDAITSTGKVILYHNPCWLCKMYHWVKKK